jgi:hypothetical protein
VRSGVAFPFLYKEKRLTMRLAHLTQRTRFMRPLKTLQPYYGSALQQTRSNFATDKPVYGSPFTNSIAFQPVNGDSVGPLPPAQEWRFMITLPGQSPVELRVHARDTIATVVRLLQDRLGVSSVQLYSNGRRLSSADDDAPITILFGVAVDLAFDGVRYSVNEGLRLSPQGSILKRTLLRSYVYLAVGAVSITVGCALFWNSVVPPGHNRMSQMRTRGE